MRVTRAQHVAAGMLYGDTQEQAEARWGTPVKRKKPTAREQPVVNAILAYLRTLPDTFAFRVNTQGVPLHDGSGGFRPGPTTGVSDILCCHHGRFYAFEAKRPDGGLVSDAQRAFLVNVQRAGGFGRVVRSVEEVRDVLSERATR